MNAPQLIPSPIELNARVLEQELAWFARVLDARFKLYFGQAADCNSVREIEPPDLASSASAYAGFVRHYGLSFAERVAVVLGLLPHLRPQLLDIFHTRNKTFDRKFTEFGGARDASGDFVPTGETLAFILAGGGSARALSRFRPCSTATTTSRSTTSCGSSRRAATSP